MNKNSTCVYGGKGFIGRHLLFFCTKKKDKKIFFLGKKDNHSKIYSCTTLVHLAGINKKYQGNIFRTNVAITKILIESLKKNLNLKKIIFASSIQRNQNNAYAKGKRESEKILKKFCNERKIDLVNLIIPNVFGEYCKPNYNSFFSTMCFNILHNKKNIINNYNKELKLIYAQDLVEEIYNNIANNKIINLSKLTYKIKIKKLEKELRLFKEMIDKNIIPNLSSQFKLKIFNAFKSYLYPKNLKRRLFVNQDYRGNLFEIIKSLNSSHIFFSNTKKNITRGNHYHTKKIEKFIVINGKAEINFRILDEKRIIKVKVNGNKPESVDIPNFCTHNIKNIGKEKLSTVFYSNEIYDKNNPDTFYEKV
jgi:UDP-2-acetamido-2,6-beta-L-arabino-hexul-4-ose reductase